MGRNSLSFIGVAGTLLVLLVLLGCTPVFPVVKPVKDTMDSAPSEPEEESLPILPEEEESAPPASGRNMVVTATVTHPVNIYGRNGFAPEVITINAGDSITWTNKDPQMKEVTLTFHEEGTRRFRTSEIILPGQEEEMVFPEQVNYTYWTVAYGTPGKIIIR